MMLILLMNLIAFAGEPLVEEIYFEKPVVVCDEACHYENDTSAVFVQANSKHEGWLKDRTISAIYNDETVNIRYPDCDFKTNTFECANKAGMWVMRTKITIDKDVASINILLFNENGVVVGQANRVSTKKRTIVEREKVVEEVVPVPPTTTTNCNPNMNGCVTVPVQPAPITTTETEDLEPSIMKTRPILSIRDIQQAMIYLYSSVD